MKKIKIHLLIIHKQLTMSMKNLEGCNPTNKTKLFIVFNDFIADTEANKKLKLIVAELFMISRKLNISLVFIS